MEKPPRIEEHIPIGKFCTFRLGGPARYFSRASSASHIPFLVERARSLRVPLHILGGGSNTICADGVIERFVIKMEENNISPVDETKTNFFIEAAAGTPWDAFVEYAVRHNTSGVEALSAIPGTVGATPIQNVGAYGQEVGGTIVHARAYDTKTDSFVTIPAKQCRFEYRGSIFKWRARGRFIITSVLFRLSKRAPKIPNYPSVRKYFVESKTRHPSPVDIRNAVITIRASKLPDPARIPNAGSFFENPVVPRGVCKKLSRKFPEIPLFAFSDTKLEIPAGWLIDQCGFKGIWKGNAGVYKKNALVLIGNRKTTYQDLMNLKDDIISAVRKKFGISLEMEPDIVI
ncbi:MAG: UDP-N-acetylmuramate dehydrogenase [Candidatus Jorgensenbacteria bacterium]|nr:UDP-N-acetylmuramate dehydrogenase [Candidatus Jorgensenbacteria bacterium]